MRLLLLARASRDRAGRRALIVMDRIRMIKSWRYARWGALMPVPPEVVRHHLGDLRLLGRAEGTIEARRLAVLRMARIIQAPLMEATAADVAAWRAGLRVLDNTAVHYACHARGFFAWAAAACPGRSATTSWPRRC